MVDLINVRKLSPIGLLLAFTLLIHSCNDKPSDQRTEDPPIVQNELELFDLASLNGGGFNADSAFYFIEKQVSFGPRVPNTDEHIACGDYLVATLERYADKVETQEKGLLAWDGNVLNARNIIAKFNPGASTRVLLCAHWDTRPWADEDTERQNEPILGANDGGSGVGVLLEVARKLSENPLTIGVDIVLFDAEDYGDSKSYQPDTYCLGSQYWARNFKGQKPVYGILLDMVGAEDAIFRREMNSTKYANFVVNKVWNIAIKSGYGNYFKQESTNIPITDDHLYINELAGIPTIDIIHYKQGFGDFWHTHDDDMDIISTKTLQAVGDVVLQVLMQENGGLPL